MVLKIAREQATARRQKYVTPGGATTFVSTYIGTNKMELLAQAKTTVAAPVGPMAYLVEQAPGSVVDPHYHQVDQFQIFVGGAGHIGIHPLEGVTVHYAGPHSPYGPIVAGPAGVQYVTLRSAWDPGAQWMPGAAAALRGMPGRKHASFTSSPLERCADPQLLQVATSREIMPQAESGLGAWLLGAGPGAAVSAGGSNGGSRFWYVLAGSVKVDGTEVADGGCVFFSGEETSAQSQAGPGGVELVLVQFPRR